MMELNYKNKSIQWIECLTEIIRFYLLIVNNI